MNKEYQKFSISLDEKQKAAEEAADRGVQFSDFFQNTFLAPITPPKPSNTDIPNPQEGGNEMTQEMKIFVDRELIQKDFKNVASIFPATLSNIYAEVKDGEYDITINRVPSRISKGELSEAIEFSGKYLFSQSVHAFYRLSLQVNSDSGGREFGGVTIALTPSRIDLTNFEKLSGELPKYIKVLRDKNYSGNEKATFDLSRQVVIIGANEYPLGS